MITFTINPGPHARFCPHCGEYTHDAMWPFTLTAEKASEFDGYTTCPLCGEDDQNDE